MRGRPISRMAAGGWLVIVGGLRAVFVPAAGLGLF
jgi:hypothetical protein